jgi:adenine deaminase
MRDGMARMLDQTGDSLHRAHQAGVKMAMGTDTGFSVAPYGEWHARELELLMTYAGMSSLEAIQAGTQHGALMLGLDGQVGAIVPGMLADIIVVDGDPVADIKVLQDKRRIETVVKDGVVQVFDEKALRRSWPHDRGQAYSVTDLTYDLVYGEPGEAGNGDAHETGNGELDASDAEDLVADLQHRETSARLC